MLGGVIVSNGASTRPMRAKVVMKSGYAFESLTEILVKPSAVRFASS